MKRVHLEILVSILFVVVGTFVAYGHLSQFANFWSAQMVWSAILVLGWIIVSLGYFRQGWLVHKSHSADHVSLALPAAAFFVQCVLFIKGIYYHDWSLITGAILVNSGVVFSLYQLVKVRSR